MQLQTTMLSCFLICFSRFLLCSSEHVKVGLQTGWHKLKMCRLKLLRKRKTALLVLCWKHCDMFSLGFLQPAMERQLAIAPAGQIVGVSNPPHMHVCGLLVEARELGENSCRHRQNMQTITLVVVVLIVVNCLDNIVYYCCCFWSSYPHLYDADRFCHVAKLWSDPPTPLHVDSHCWCSSVIGSSVCHMLIVLIQLVHPKAVHWQWTAGLVLSL